jgi:hypothetical protein
VFFNNTKLTGDFTRKKNKMVLLLYSCIDDADKFKKTAIYDFSSAIKECLINVASENYT